MSASLLETIKNMHMQPDCSLFSQRSHSELSAVVTDAVWTGSNVKIIQCAMGGYHRGYYIVFENKQDKLQFSLRFGHKL